ncbi:hypothetical protein [Vibrio vulnificus]|uniref:hypothetical protein n=1 Tax=Vibrio vulnificus TaxID=672 RepID=UPI001EF9F9A5|nr:hypothetical protein [Vibrio vulnificus]
MSKLVVYLSAIVVACLVVAEPAFAGPGGKIASVLSETFWGKGTNTMFINLFFTAYSVRVLQGETS